MRIAVTAFCLAIVFAVACTATPPPSAPQVDFTVHCKNGADLALVKVVTDEGRDKANVSPKPGHANQPHFGSFSYNLQSAGQKFGIEVGCGRLSYNPDDADYKNPKTLNVSDQTSWGTGRDFVCTPDPVRTGVCEIAPKDVAITPSCSGSASAVATGVFVTPTAGQAGSATLVQGGIFIFSLSTPVEPYLVRVECQQGDQKWRAESVAPTIGAANFNCTRPSPPHGQHGYCTRPLHVG